MSFDSQNPTALDHLESASKLNKAMAYRLRAGKMDAEWFLTMIAAQARNLTATQQMLSAKIAQMNSLPRAALHAIDDMIATEQDKAVQAEFYQEFPSADASTCAMS